MMDYDYRLILLSLLAAFVTSLAAVSLASTIYRTQIRFAKLWMLASATAIGSATWAAHFAGILVFSPHSALGTNLKYLALSWAIIVASSCLALRMAGRPKLAPRLFLVNSVLVGMGISGMYYASMYGMYGLHGNGYEVFSPGLFTLFAS